MENTAAFFEEPLDQNPAEIPVSEPYNPLKDGAYVAGLILLVLSFGLFALSNFYRVDTPIFFISFLLIWIYTITLWAGKRLRWWMFGARRTDYPVVLLLLMLWLVSCFALNQEVPIFKSSVPWLQWHLCISGLACVAFGWHERMPVWGRQVLWFALSSSAVLFTYYAIVLLPLTGMGVLFVWFFGLPLHAWVPLVLTVYLILILRNAVRDAPEMRLPVISGLAVPILITIVFAGAWYRVSHQVATLERDFEKMGSYLPKWVFISQHLQQNRLNGYLLEAVAEGTLNVGNNGNDFFDTGWINTYGVTKNDPLMQIAASVAAKSNLTADDCRKIYTAQYDSRNVMEERLWSGDDLLTTDVQSNVMLDPGHRLSYTEKILTVANSALIPTDGPRRWLASPGTQEAIYTFYLPEGGVVTALSLWIEGKEEPGVLTSRSKAKEAYTTIVGRERRDPAVVFWQEGNQVRVRVFPVTPDMPRQFKVGITAPLRYEEGKQVYDNITFDGPSALSATQTDSIYIEGRGKFVSIPNRFKLKGGFISKGNYQHRWSVSCEGPPVLNTFSFDGKSYSISLWNAQSEPFRPANIYVDLNAAWTQPELAKIRSLLGSYAVLVATSEGELQPLTEENAAHVFQQSRSLRFSLFPFYKIEHPENSLLLTKSAAPTPLPLELDDSQFGKNLQTWSASGLRVFHLGDSDHLSAYLRAFQENRSLFCVSGNIELLEKHLRNQTFPKNPENAHTVAIPASGVLISEMQGVASGKAPDHLFRLFAYNTILKTLGNRKPGEVEPERLVQLAEQAYVVTPVSSLVTLETQADYDRFDIKPTEGLQSLGNAGAVPEPHEWALIVLLTISAVLIWRKKI